MTRDGFSNLINFLNGAVLAVPFLFLAASLATAAPFYQFKDCDVCPEMIELPSGEFLMGAPLGELQQGYRFEDGEWRLTGEEPPFYNSREQPIHPVTIDIPFAMGRNEVTYEEWMACVNDGGCNGYVPRADSLVRLANDEVVSMEFLGSHPVVMISFLDALSYVDWLNGKAGTTLYRLPTEAEWEYAARAGTQTPFAQGMDVTKDQVNFGSVAWARARASGEPREVIGAHPVRVEELDAANAWGLRHVSGNVAEITMSCFTDQHMHWSLTSEYLQDAEDGGRCDRTVRGGHYINKRSFARPASRTPTDYDMRVRFDGFRVLREMTNLPN